MADEPIDTEKLRGLVEMATQMDGDCSGSVVAADIVLAQAGGLLDELERLRAENQRLREDVATRILTATLPHCRATRDLERAGVELPLSLHFEGYGLAADIMGVPADNTSEMDVAGFVMETGEWPEGVYCRDWLVNLWCEVEDGKATIADVVAALVEAAREARE